MKKYCTAAFLAAGLVLASSGAFAQACPNRGDLDEAYCDANKDLVADIPEKTRDPSVIVFAYTPVEDPAVYEHAFKPFTEYLAQCTACHHPSDPSLPGSVGPELKGTSRDVLEAKLLRGTYPDGYTPKRSSRVMQPMPGLASDIDALAEYLN